MRSINFAVVLSLIAVATLRADVTPAAATLPDLHAVPEERRALARHFAGAGSEDVNVVRSIAADGNNFEVNGTLGGIDPASPLGEIVAALKADGNPGLKDADGNARVTARFDIRTRSVTSLWVNGRSASGKYSLYDAHVAAAARALGLANQVGRNRLNVDPVHITLNERIGLVTVSGQLRFLPAALQAEVGKALGAATPPGRPVQNDVVEIRATAAGKPTSLTVQERVFDLGAGGWQQRIKAAPPAPRVVPPASGPASEIGPVTGPVTNPLRAETARDAVLGRGAAPRAGAEVTQDGDLFTIRVRPDNLDRGPRGAYGRILDALAPAREAAPDSPYRRAKDAFSADEPVLVTVRVTGDSSTIVGFQAGGVPMSLDAGSAPAATATPAAPRAEPSALPAVRVGSAGDARNGVPAVRDLAGLPPPLASSMRNLQRALADLPSRPPRRTPRQQQIYTRHVQQVQTLLATVTSLAQKDYERGRRKDAGDNIGLFRPTYANVPENRMALMQRIPDQMAGIQQQIASDLDPRPAMIRVFIGLNELVRR